MVSWITRPPGGRIARHQPQAFSGRLYQRRRGRGSTRYAVMELPQLARPEGYCDSYDYLCEGSGLCPVGTTMGWTVRLYHSPCHLLHLILVSDSDPDPKPTRVPQSSVGPNRVPGPPGGRRSYVTTYLGTAGRGTPRVTLAAGEHHSQGAPGRIDPVAGGRDHMGAAQRIWLCWPNRVQRLGASPQKLCDFEEATWAQSRLVATNDSLCLITARTDANLPAVIRLTVGQWFVSLQFELLPLSSGEGKKWRDREFW